MVPIGKRRFAAGRIAIAAQSRERRLQTSPAAAAATAVARAGQWTEAGIWAYE
jgi:hypothetical protein